MPFAAGDAAVDFAVAVVVAVGWTADFAAAVAVVESVDFVFPMLLRNPYDVVDSLGVESVLNYSFHQNSMGFSAADHWDPACVTADFLSYRLRLQLLIAGSSWAPLDTAAKWHSMPTLTVSLETATR